MKQDDDKIDYLLAGKAAETLNSEELIEINTLISEDTSIQERWQSLMNALPASGLPQVNWADLSTIVQKPKRKLLLLKKLAAAAVLTGICVTSYLYFPKTQKQVVANNTIQLKLANGQVIDLGKEKGSLAAGDAQLSNTQHTLTYTVNGKEKPGLNSLTVPVGKDYKITLIDGTEVWLNSASQ